MPPRRGPGERLSFSGIDRLWLGIARGFFRDGILRRLGLRRGLLRACLLLRQKFGVARLPVRDLASVCLAFGDAIAEPFDPGAHLNGDAAGDTSGPHQLERRELPPVLIAFDDGAGDESAGHGGGVEAVTTEAGREPDAGTELAELR